MKKNFLAGIMALCIVCGTNVLGGYSIIKANADETVESGTEITDDSSETDEVENENSGSWGKNGTWKLDDNGLLTISGTGKFIGLNDVLTYSDIAKVKGIKVEEGITEICESAFKSYSKLEYVELPDTLTIIGDKVFYDCDLLYDIQLPDSITNIGASAFYSCGMLSEIELPENLEIIGESAFQHCETLRKIVIPENVISMGKSVFESCTALYDVELPDSLTILNSNSFYGCSLLKNIKLPANLTIIDNFAFRGCSLLADIELPDSLVYIKEDAFAYCTSLTSIVIPDSVIIIESGAFASSGLTEITLGSKIQKIGYSAFQNTNIETAIYRGSKKSWDKVNVEKALNSALINNIKCIAEPGDANVDGDTTIADAVFIMQSLSNADEYSLSDNGMLNADVLDGDGVSSADALIVQMVVANTITSDVLPLTSEELAEINSAE